MPHILSLRPPPPHILGVGDLSDEEIVAPVAKDDFLITVVAQAIDTPLGHLCW